VPVEDIWTARWFVFSLHDVAILLVRSADDHAVYDGRLPQQGAALGRGWLSGAFLTFWTCQRIIGNSMPSPGAGFNPRKSCPSAIATWDRRRRIREGIEAAENAASRDNHRDGAAIGGVPCSCLAIGHTVARAIAGHPGKTAQAFSIAAISPASTRTEKAPPVQTLEGKLGNPYECGCLEIGNAILSGTPETDAENTLVLPEYDLPAAGADSCKRAL